jgi:RNA polymerase sigma-70 factor (ECF subfamily)
VRVIATGSGREQVRGASPAEIESVYRDRFDQMLRVCRAIVGSEEAAYDAVQEGVARALRNRSQFARRGSLEGWMWRAVVNAARNARRAESRSPSVVTQHMVQVDDGGRARGLIACLPERQRLMVFLRYYAEMSYEDIAEALEISPGTVGATLTAARAALRSQLEEA